MICFVAFAIILSSPIAIVVERLEGRIERGEIDLIVPPVEVRNDISSPSQV